MSRFGGAQNRTSDTQRKSSCALCSDNNTKRKCVFTTPGQPCNLCAEKGESICGASQQTINYAPPFPMEAHCEAIKQHGWQPPQRILNMHSMDEIILGIRIAWTEGTGRPLQQDLEIQRPFETHYLAALDKFPDNTFDTSCANLTGRETEPEQITHAILTCRCFHILRQLGGMKTNLEGYMSENQNTTALLNLQLMQRLLCHFLELVQTDMDYIRSATRPGSTLHDVTIAYACAGLLYSKFANFKNNLKKEPYKMPMGFEVQFTPWLLELTEELHHISIATCGRQKSWQHLLKRSLKKLHYHGEKVSININFHHKQPQPTTRSNFGPSTVTHLGSGDYLGSPMNDFLLSTAHPDSSFPSRTSAFESTPRIYPASSSFKDFNVNPYNDLFSQDTATTSSPERDSIQNPVHTPEHIHTPVLMEPTLSVTSWISGSPHPPTPLLPEHSSDWNPNRQNTDFLAWDVSAKASAYPLHGYNQPTDYDRFNYGFNSSVLSDSPPWFITQELEPEIDLEPKIQTTTFQVDPTTGSGGMPEQPFQYNRNGYSDDHSHDHPNTCT